MKYTIIIYFFLIADLNLLKCYAIDDRSDKSSVLAG